MESRERKIKRLEAKFSAVEDGIFGQFCAEVGLQDIRCVTTCMGRMILDHMTWSHSHVTLGTCDNHMTSMCTGNMRSRMSTPTRRG